ncbi:MAG TPA: transporter substrate-binding domain-containing protein [Verrucomicrobiae bacterium]|jgi:polar amino acid transport system substrate-binding protein|nr:transporter substrate-binding domain-containing protein [Verrucomicrobiae bacterium]
MKFAPLTIIFLTFLLTGCGEKPSNRLVVGMELAYPPFEMTDQQGQPAGVSVDLARDLAKQLGRSVDIENIPFSGLIPSLQTHKIDLIISSMTATPERAKSIAFSDAYLKTGLCLLVGKNSPIQSIADADQPGRTIAVKQGTTGNVYATDNIKRAKVLILDKEDACVLEVVQGKADAFIYDQISTYENWRRNTETTRAILKPFTQESWAIGLRLDDTNLLQAVNQFLKDYKAGGGFDRLGDHYLKEQKEAFAKLGYPFYF